MSEAASVHFLFLDIVDLFNKLLQDTILMLNCRGSRSAHLYIRTPLDDLM